MAEGIINFLKPAGMTSHDAVAMLRRLTGVKRIGHTGTLDPMAAGVLPLCIGSAARISEYLDLDEKEYRCELALGVVTDTQDIWGEVLSRSGSGQVAQITEAMVEEAFAGLSGNVLQVPPKYSALKVDGKRLYEYAREGKEVEIKARPAAISKIHILSFDKQRGRVTFDVTCSKGTYIRSVCSDAGENLGVGAAMSFLLRHKTGSFHVKDAVSAEQLADYAEAHHDSRGKSGLEPFVRSVDAPLSHLGRLEVNADRGLWFSRGGYLRKQDVRLVKPPAAANLKDEALQKRIRHLGLGDECRRLYCVYCGSRFLGVALYRPDREQYIADKIFNTEGQTI